MWPYYQCNFRNSWSYKICIQPVSWSPSASGPAAVVNNNKPWFAHECLWFSPCTFNPSLFLQSQIHDIIFPLSFSFKGEQCLVKMPLEQSALWSSLPSTNMTLCSQQAKGWNLLLWDPNSPQGNGTKGGEAPHISQSSRSKPHEPSPKSVSLCSCRASVSSSG